MTSHLVISRVMSLPNLVVVVTGGTNTGPLNITHITTAGQVSK